MSEKKKIISIHQPSYLPWIGYIHKIATADLFVLHDNVQFSKNSMYRRTFIRKDEIHKTLLVIPLNKHSDFEKIKNLTICNSTNWQKKHINKIKNAYNKSPFYDMYFRSICDIVEYSKNEQSFSDYIEYMLKSVLSLLSINFKMVRSSELSISGYKSQYNIDLIKHFDGNVYLSGAGAFKYYQKTEEFHCHKIAVLKQDIYAYMENNPYYQNGYSFLNGMSIIDALFNIGENGIKRILEGYSKEMFNQLSNVNVK